MPLHPIIEAQLKLAAGKAPYYRLPLTEARAAARTPYLAQPSPAAVSAVRDLTIPGPRGDIAARLYTPFDGGPRPLVVFFHGSGFTLLDLDTHDDMCRRLCVESGCMVASIDYALAPERPFPQAPEDCIAATLWLHENAASLGCRVGAVGLAGDSAGACLAAVTALELRDVDAMRGSIGALLMWYPVTDHPSSQWPSFTEFGEGYGLSAEGMKWFWAQYLPETGAASDQKASPLRAPSLAGMPPTWVNTAEYDVLRDEGEAFAARLQAQGVAVQMKRSPGMNHGFLKYLDVIDEATESMREAGKWLRSALNSEPG